MRGEKDVSQGPPGGVGGDGLGLHAVDDGGHAEVDVRYEEEQVEGKVVIESSSVDLLQVIYFLNQSVQSLENKTLLSED